MPSETNENKRLAIRQKIAVLATEIESLTSQISKLKADINAKSKEMGDLKRSLRTDKEPNG